ncbi:TRAP transporter large permease [Celeribacter indicus]|uniref:TRAP transporter large permease protein n=1 Tax=Celeribacter indicus TaxID=1208324 RepID=A0A0B5DVV0_9RHOB|nr:TRAP transporter large permease [Celeribacter indicus]AJE44886.1 putative TRAP-type C4-dicarboxylate transport system large permease [Celeribacter indicus]SDX22738.1 TRAP transporter, DctM subunit [Celeribacter indicus]
MEWYLALLLMIGLVVGLMLFGTYVAMAFLAANIVGALVFLGGGHGLDQLVRNITSGLAQFNLAPIMMFILMGEILFETKVAFRAIDAVERLFARVPGRLSHAAVMAGTVFGTLSGSSLANTSLLGATLIPEMLKRGYHKSMAMGPILGSGGIAMLIPPSNLAVLLGSLSGASISGILIAAAIPGVFIALSNVIYIVARCRMNPSLAPNYEIPVMSFGDRIKPFLIYVMPLFALFMIVVGSIFAGIATPTESAALGAVGALIAAALYRSLTWENFMRSLRETGKISVMIFFIIGSSLTFSQILAFSGATQGLLSVLGQFDPTPLTMVCAMMLVVLVMGCFMDPLSIILITLPFFIPIVDLIGFDKIWFAVIMLLALEIGQITPPFGLLLFCMKSVAPSGTTMHDIYKAVTPFILLQILTLVALILMPSPAGWIATVLR